MDTRRRYFRSLNLLLFFTGLTFATSWLPLLRGLMDGESYSWGTTFLGKTFSGSGAGGDFYYVVLNALLGLFLLCSFYWVRQRLIFYLLLVLWYGSIIANAFYEVGYGEGYYFHGDTLGIHVNLSYVIIPFVLFLGFLAVKVIKKDRKNRFRARWIVKNTYWLAALLLPIFPQYLLFSGGEPHGITDQIGVLLALLQLLMVAFPLKAYSFAPDLKTPARP